MAQIIKEIMLEVSKPNLFQALVAKQYDNNSRFLKVTFVNDGEKIPVAPESTVIINAVRKDGQANGFYGEANDDGTATVPLDSWMLELDGTVDCDVSIIDSEQRRLTSTTFYLAVERAAYGGENITKDENYDIWISLLDKTEEALETAKKAEENTLAAAQAATVANEAAARASEAAKVNFEYGGSHVITLTTDGWEHDGEKYVKTIAVDGVLESDSVIVSPSPGSIFAYGNCAIICADQKDGFLTFTAQTQPQENTLVYILVITEKEA